MPPRNNGRSRGGNPVGHVDLTGVLTLPEHNSEAVQAMARKCALEALLALRDIVTDEAAPASARVTAAGIILDRAVGKVAAKVESKHTDMTQLHLAAMREHLSQQNKGEHAQVIDNTGVST